MKNNFFRKWLVLSALFAFMCFSPHILLRAQSTANYAFTTSTSGSLGLDMNGNTVDMSTGTTQLVAADLDNSSSTVTAIGFNYVFYGSTFTQFSASSNGLIQLGSSAVSASGYTVSGGSLASPRFGALVADLRTGIAGKVHYKVVGTAPNRCLVIEFLNMSITYVATPGSNDGTYQVRLYETSGAVEYVYGSMFKNASNTGAAAIHAGFSVNTTANTFAAITTATNTVSYTTFNTNTYTNSTNIANLHSTVDGSRRVYLFTPPAVPVAPTALTFAPVGSTTMTLNWVDNSTTEYAYTVSRSLDGISYTNVGTLPANSTSYAASGLAPSTLYYWNVTASSESGTSTPVSGSQATNAGTLSGIKTVGAGGDYQNLTTAFADINANGLAGNVELQLISGYPAAPETYPILSCNSIATGTFNVKVYPTVSGLSITSANTTGTLNLNNATNVTFDGRVNQTGANDLVIANTNAGASYAVQFVNDARNNALQYLTIQSTNTSTTSGTIVFAGSTGTTGNDNNLIDHCDIKDGATTPANAIYSAGTSTTIDNSGNTVSNSNIFNYFNAGNNSNGIFLSSNSSAWTINANKFYQTATRTSTASGNQYRGINIVTSSGNGYVITNNVIGYSSAAGTGVMTYNGAFTNRYFAIELTASNTGTASSIQGNTITGISLTTTSGTTAAPGVFAGISVLSGTVSIGNTTPNVIGSATGTGAISVTTSNTATIYGIHANSSATLNVSNNTIGSISGTGSVAGATCNITGINLPGSGTASTVNGNTIGGTTANSIASGTSGTTTAGATINGILTSAGSVTTLGIDGNTISNLTILGASGTIYGVNSGTSQYTINNNSIHDLRIPTNAGSNASIIYGLYNLVSPTVENITNNQIYNLSVAGATTSTGNIVMGIHSNTTTSTKDFSVNQINGLSFANSSTGTAIVNGISSVTGTAVSIFRNKIYNLSASGTGSTVNGILNSGGTTVNVYNNVIGDLKAPTASGTTDAIRGISVTSTATNSIYRVYYNSVYLDAASTGTNFGTSGIYHAASATATTAALDLRNNIIINASTPAGTGITAAFRRSAVALGNFASTSNRNMLYAGTPSATRLIMYDGTNAYQTMATYQTAVAARELNSFTGEPGFTGAGYGTAGNFFISTTPSAADYLKPVAGITTQVESGASAIATPAITNDYAAAIRQGNAGYAGTGTAPDLGAFEFEGVTPTPIITLNSVTPPATVQCAATARVISVDVNPSAGTTASVMLGYAVNGVAQTAISMTNSSGSTWTGTIPAPTPGNATITWGITATNSVGVSGIYTGTAYADEPLFGTTSTATTSVSTICAGSSSDVSAKLTKSNGTVILGAGSLATTGSGSSGSNYVSPFNHYYGGYKAQYVVRASELTAAGLSAGNITALAFDVTAAGTTYNGFKMSIAPTASTVATATFLTGSFTDVYTGNLNVATTGLNTITFSTPFNWNGTSNIVIELCWSNNNGGGTAAEVKYDATSFVSQANYRVDTQTPATVCGTTTSSATQSNRPKMVFTGVVNVPITAVSWSDGVGTVGTTNPLTVSPTATTTYTATITAAGCTVTPSPTTTVTVNPLPSAPTAVNSAQCGVQTPTAHVTSTSGLPTPSFNWYAASSGGTALQSSTSTTYASTVSATTTFYVSELNSVTGCESTRVPVTVTVSTPDQVSLTASVASVCIGGTFTLTAANTNPTPFQTYTYSTESAATGSGAETPLAGTTVSVTPTAAGTFTYTVTGVDGGCAASATASVVVNPLPVVTATASPATVCSGDNISLVGNITSGNSGPFVVGAGALIGSGDYYDPFYHLFGGIKSQYIIPASELTAAGLTAGNITSVALNIGTVGGPYNGFTIHVGTTTATNLSAGLDASALTQVYSNPSLAMTASSLNTFTFSTPFAWNGTSNVIVQLSWSNNNGGGTSSEIRYDNTAYVATAYYRGDNMTPATILSGTTATGTRSTRPKMTFGMSQNSNYTWSWSPGTGLNTPSATTSITNASGSAVTQAFTVTTTSIATGCVSTTTTPAVTINSSVPAPVANNSTQCGTGTPTASVTGTGAPGNTFSWYLVSSGGTAISGQTGSSLSGYPITATTTFYVSENSAAGCMSPRTPVTVTVTPAPAITVAGTATICQGSSTSLTASSANTGYTYTWSGGLGTGATVSASPTTGTTYTVTGTDMSGGANNGCVNTATYAITVNPAPATAPVVPATATICAGDLQHLTSGPTTSTAIFGNGTTAPSSTSYPNPLSAYYGGAKHQILFTAAELTAQGLVPGSQISKVTFDLNTFAGGACTNFTIRMGNTAVTALTGFVAGTTTVYGPTTFTPSTGGLVTFTLTAPYTWNGTSNIVVETVHNAGNGGNGSGTRTNTTTTLANTVYYAAADDVLGGIAGFDALTSWDVNAASNLRPNVRFLYTGAGPVWSPSASLYTDAAGTVAYTGTGTSSVYAKPTTTTTYVVTYTGSNGCTAQTSATITVNQPTASTVAPVTACTSYTWPQTGMTYTTSGVYRDTIPNAAGCDSVISLNLTINQPSASTVTEIACQTYTWAQNGMTYTTSGSYTDTIPNVLGCDSVVTLNLTIGAPNGSLFTMTACGSYVWPQTGLTYTVSGAYNDTLTNMYGCDSVITLSLTINQPSTSTAAPVTQCTSYTWPQTGMTYTVSGAYTDTLTNAAGCDSIITLNLTIIQPTTSSVSATACGSYTWAQNGMTYTASGAYMDTIPNAAGCDSIITLNLTINSVTTSTVTVSTCNPTYTWAQNGMVYTASGSYMDTIPNAAGCDSIVTLNLTIAPFVATATVNANATITASAGTTYQWINCTTNTPVAGATAQTFAPTANGSYAVIVSNGTCTDTSTCVNVTNVGIKESTITTISVHPNPTHDVVTVTMEAASAVVEVMDVQGKLVQTTLIKSGDQIDLSTYERGVYTLRVKTELGTAIERIVKN